MLPSVDHWDYAHFRYFYTYFCISFLLFLLLLAGFSLYLLFDQDIGGANVSIVKLMSDLRIAG